MNKSIVTTSVLIGIATLGPAAPALAQAGRTYEVDVTAAGQDGMFQDCFTFNDDGSLDLVSLSNAFAWKRLNKDRKNNSFQAVNVPEKADDFNVAFSGKAKAGTIKADGVNSFGASFGVTGKSVNACSLTRRPPGSNPWRFGR